MSQSEKNWDDIPSLDGLEIDWDFEPENPMGKRAYARLGISELKLLFQKAEIPVKVATQKRQFNSVLVDVSQGGASIQTHKKGFELNQLIKIAFFLGTEKVISKAIIRNIRDDQGNSLLGIEFVGLSENSNEFIAGLYSSVKIRD